MINRELIVQAIDFYANSHELDASVVYGICMQESLLNPLAARHEKFYNWVINPECFRPKYCSLETEIFLQKTSWGLMQMMGAVFRELGYTDWLTRVITDYRLQLEYGCRYLGQKMEKYGMVGGIVAYNSGRPKKNADGKYINQDYLDKVLEYSHQHNSRG